MPISFFRRRERDHRDAPPDDRVDWRRGLEYGFSGAAAHIWVSSGYHRPFLWDAPEPCHHLTAAHGYFQLIARHAYDLASERGDAIASAELDAAHDDLANATLTALDRIRAMMQRRDYAVSDLEPRRRSSADERES